METPVGEQGKRMTKCFCCGQEVSTTECARCSSGHVRTSVVEFFWNGWLAKRVEVAWCRSCDFVWLVDHQGTIHPVCRDCRERMLSVEKSVIPTGIAA
jgi:hypothetical protein